MNIYAFIIGLKRLANRLDKIDTVDSLSVRAARKVVSTSLDFETTGVGGGGVKINSSRFGFVHFILFYPFCAFFTLYEYIVDCTNPEDCEADVRLLEQVGDAMEHTSTTARTDLKPFAETIKALNKVSRVIQDYRRNKRAPPAQLLSVDANDTQQQTDGTDHHMTIPDLDPSAFDTFPDFPMTMDGEPEPLSFVRAMEDFICRNWHESWWDMSGGMNNGMAYMSDGTALGQQ
ncbi:uncharacterized protein EKO05_0001662 [Ascochyta rabiei]|nr:uncharacterized protein EKO05_0001662 [Ascochyta rabiei]UPX11036.1 hypothetical protein EKO05_0001662 [Ascochyta rabiei]